MEKKTIAVLFGGQSSEHEVSCKSAVNVINHIDQDTYRLILIGITKEGKWLLTPGVKEIEDGSWYTGTTSACILPDAQKKCVLLMDASGVKEEPVDLVFPVLHGKFGEDGTIQGLLELARIPYVGCGVIASANGMDKLYTKIVAQEALKGLECRQAEYVPIFAYKLADMEHEVARVEASLSYPVFIKPANAGSSCGVSKAHDRRELEKGLRKAAEFDSEILVEEMIYGHEVECAVFGCARDGVEATCIGEIKAAAEFYDYDAKYNNPESKTVCDPQDIEPEKKEIVRSAAKAIFKALSGYGLSRVDFFIAENGEVIFNEINTLPGFTAISMYPMLWEAEGVGKKELVSRLIESGFRRYE